MQWLSSATCHDLVNNDSKRVFIRHLKPLITSLAGRQWGPETTSLKNSLAVKHDNVLGQTAFSSSAVLANWLTLLIVSGTGLLWAAPSDRTGSQSDALTAPSIQTNSLLLLLRLSLRNSIWISVACTRGCSTFIQERMEMSRQCY